MVILPSPNYYLGELETKLGFIGSYSSFMRAMPCLGGEGCGKGCDKI